MRGLAERAIRREDLLHYRLPSFQRKVANAERVIEEGLRTMTRGYCAFSGGKDSLAVLALVRRQAPTVTVNWTDEELVYPENLEYIPRLAREWNLNLLITTGVDLHGDWFWAWRDPPFWHEPLPGTVMTGWRYTHLWLADQGYDGVFLGLRKAEAMYRRHYLNAMGRLHRCESGWRCNPLANWTVDDTWALLAGQDLPYNPVYDRLAAIGVPRAEQRVGPLPLSVGWHLRLGWPEMWRRLNERYGHRWGP